MPPRSFAPTKLRALTVDAETLDAITAVRGILAKARSAPCANAEAFAAIVRGVVRTPNLQMIKVVADGVGPPGQVLSRIYVRSGDLEPARRAAVRSGTPFRSFLKASTLLFLRASIRSLSRQSDGAELAEAAVAAVESLRRAGSIVYRPRVLRQRNFSPAKTSRADRMKYHNYLEIFKSHMEQYGGLERIVSKTAICPVYVLPIKGTPGKETASDLLISENPGAMYIVRFWPRGRGYNVTFLSHRPELQQPGPDSSTNPDTGETVERPEVPVGQVFRLYDVYRNIDWANVQIIDEV